MEANSLTRVWNKEMRILKGTAVAFALVLSVSSAYAVPITDASGGWGGAFSPNANTIVYGSGGLGQVNPVQPASDGFGFLTVGAYSVSNLTLDVTPFSSNPGTVIPSGTFTVTGTALSGADAGNSATFAFFGTTTLEELGNADSVTGTVQLMATNITGIDFGSPGTAFDFAFSTQTVDFIPGVPGTLNIQGNTASASFTLSRRAEPGPLPIPEPASMLVWSLIALAGIGGYLYTRRRRFAGQMAA